tara:strand:- start:2984 stop:3496 length:513 start_codon:yes stop_codon:yes gene_type:complete
MLEQKHTPEGRAITDWHGKQRITWCGPYAIATVSGTAYEPAYQAAKRARGKRHAKGITCRNLKDACASLGVNGTWKMLSKKRALRKFIEESLMPNEVYVVNITKHFIVIDTRDWTTIDNQSLGWCAVENSKHKNKMVHGYFKVENPNFEPSHQNRDFRDQQAEMNFKGGE